MRSAIPGVLVAVVLLTGCSGMRVYDNGINHMYLCAVHVVREKGYQLRDQDFKRRKGTLVAALSMPDPRETPMKRGFFKRVSETVWNLWEHGRFEFWDDDIARKRIKTESRVVVNFREGSGPLSWIGLGSKNRTTVKLSADTTDYGREDWVISRKKRGQDVGDDIHAAMAECLGNPSAIRRARTKRKPVAVAPAPQPAVERQAPPQRVAEPDPVAAPVRPATKPGVNPAEEPAAALEKGRKLYELGGYGEAIDLLESVLAAEPGNAEALGYLGASHYQAGHLDAAIAVYERYMAAVPRDLRTKEFLEELRQEAKGR